MSRIARIWYHRNSHRWTDVIENIIKSYNATYHHTLKLAPRDVTAANSADVFRNIYHARIIDKPGKPTFKIGDRVNVIGKKVLFRKAYKQTFSHQTYIIKEVLKTVPITYTLLTEDGDTAEGSYYMQELVPAFSQT